MSYRSNLEASLAANRALRAELAAKEKTIAKLRARAESKSFLPSLARPKKTRESSDTKLGPIRIVAPRTWAPLFGLWKRGMRDAYRYVGGLQLPPSRSDRVMVWLAMQCARPLVALMRITLWAALTLVVAPISAVNMASHSLLLLPALALSTLRFTATFSNDGGAGWLDGFNSKDDSDDYFLSTWALPPLCLPALWLFISLFAYL